MKFNCSRGDIASPSLLVKANPTRVKSTIEDHPKAIIRSFLRTFSADEDDLVGNESKPRGPWNGKDSLRGSRTIRININWATSRLVISNVNDPFTNFFTPGLPRIFDTDQWFFAVIVREKYSTAVFTTKISVRTISVLLNVLNFNEPIISVE